MKFKIQYSLIILFLAFASCETREWDNPYDPDCPKELFTPDDFKAVQQDSLVVLSWTQANTHISGFVIERSVDGRDWSLVATLTKTENTSNDLNIIGGILYQYRLKAQAGNNFSNEVTAQVTALFASSITTNPITKLLSTSAILGGTITDDGGSPITSRGVCWNTSPKPAISNPKTADGAGKGVFTSTISGLNANTIYYVRAYAITDVGTTYGNEISFETYFGEVTDIDGNVYPTVKIGEQIWMAENLKVTKYNDGMVIPNITDNTMWSGMITGAYCSYNNDTETNNDIYGALYNWHAINTGKLAPQGWHVPNDSEWTILTDYLGGASIDAGDKLKETGTSHWNNPNTGATNIMRFTALPGGFRETNGGFYYKGAHGYWWSSTDNSTTQTWGRDMGYSSSDVGRNYSFKEIGFSVRCILGELEATTPTINTLEASTITTNSAILGGDVTSDGNATVTERGVVYSNSQNPTTSDTKVVMGSGTGNFSTKISGLIANTTYYVSAFAINELGTSYGDEITFTTYFGEVTDIDGNVYQTVRIGEQEWIAQHLKVTTYNDGTAIPNVIDGTEWSNLSTGAYCWQDNLIGYKDVYGALYNWYAVNTQKLCPAGWHVPLNSEWEQLASSLGGASVAGSKMKETGLMHWVSPNTGATNSSGFTALPGGWRAHDNGTFQYLGRSFTYYASDERDATTAYAGYILSEANSIVLTYSDKKRGRSVRCILGENPEPNVTVPNVSTTSATSITSSSVHLETNVISDGNSTVTERGFCWGSWTNTPTIEQDSVTRVGEGVGSFNADLVWLYSNTTYYVRAYAKNSKGISYGETVSFNTSDEIITGTFIDTRDDKTYKWVEIGEQIWMAENLAYLPSVSPSSVESETEPYYYVYGYEGTDVSIAKATDNYSTYGVLYNWPAANVFCPNGWHLPSDDEWKQLEMAIGMRQSEADDMTWRGTDEGYKLKKTNGWYNNGNGIDKYDFSALPGGGIYNGSFDKVGDRGRWWSCTELNNSSVWDRILDYNSSEVNRNISVKKTGLSVRCIRD